MPRNPGRCCETMGIVAKGEFVARNITIQKVCQPRVSERGNRGKIKLLMYRRAHGGSGASLGVTDGTPRYLVA